MKYEPKPLFLERIKLLLIEEKDFQGYLKTLETQPRVSIRCNTLKISVKELKARLEKKAWQISQPFKDYPEIFIIDSRLLPGELGKTIEHQLGYYYVQEITSMMPVLALNPKPNERVLDLCSSPGSKTTQIASIMQNTGTIIANDRDMGRIQILASNLERCGVANTIITKKDGAHLTELMEKQKFQFDKILIDAPCSGEGTFRSSPKGMQFWSINTVRKLSTLQKQLIKSAHNLLADQGVLVYSTCTHSPEENEQIVSYAVEELKMKVESINLPLKCRPGIKQWQSQEFNKQVENCCRIYPQDNDSEGFFIAKLIKKK